MQPLHLVTQRLRGGFVLSQLQVRGRNICAHHMATLCGQCQCDPAHTAAVFQTHTRLRPLQTIAHQHRTNMLHLVHTTGAKGIYVLVNLCFAKPICSQHRPVRLVSPQLGPLLTHMRQHGRQHLGCLHALHRHMLGRRAHRRHGALHQRLELIRFHEICAQAVQRVANPHMLLNNRCAFWLAIQKHSISPRHVLPINQLAHLFFPLSYWYACAVMIINVLGCQYGHGDLANHEVWMRTGGNRGGGAAPTESKSSVAVTTP